MTPANITTAAQTFTATIIDTASASSDYYEVNFFVAPFVTVIIT